MKMTWKCELLLLLLLYCVCLYKLISAEWITRHPISSSWTQPQEFPPPLSFYLCQTLAFRIWAGPGLSALQFFRRVTRGFRLRREKNTTRHKYLLLLKLPKIKKDVVLVSSKEQVPPPSLQGPLLGSLFWQK